MASSYNALTPADREAYGITDEQPTSADLAAKGPATNPFGENSPNSNDPHPYKDGQKNPPLKDGKPNPPTKPSKG